MSPSIRAELSEYRRLTVIPVQSTSKVPLLKESLSE